jgi:hypothetical protein
MGVLAVSGRLSFWVAENRFFMIPIESVIRDQQAGLCLMNFKLNSTGRRFLRLKGKMKAIMQT